MVHSAERENLTPLELCNRNAALFKALADKIGLSYTNFIRTSDRERHWRGAQLLWSLCVKNNDIYKKKYRGFYCVGCEAFYDPSDLENGLCPEHKIKPEIVEEENYFFRLSKYQSEILSIIKNNRVEIIPEKRKAEVISFIERGLEDFSISRSKKRVKNWGVPIENDDSQVMYVWFDALSSYLTSIGFGSNEKQFSLYWPADVHVIGKGILRFHAIYWIAILLSANLALPKKILVHGYITVNGEKMSKSLGNVVDPITMIEKYGEDVLRYYLISEIPTFDDGDFSEKLLIEKNNNELLANVGNLINRVFTFISNNFDSQVPLYTPTEKDLIFLENQKLLSKQIENSFESFNLREALLLTLQFSSNINRYIQENEPWKLLKNDKVRAATVISLSLSNIKDLAILLYPFMPNTSKTIASAFQFFNYSWNEIGSLITAQKIKKPPILFKKL